MKKKSYIFWILSSKGTDSQEIVKLDSNLKANAIRLELERWCEQFGAFHISENHVSYGWAVANKINLAKLVQYQLMRWERHKQIDLLIKYKISADDFNLWLNKNKKKSIFPFK